MNKVNRTFALLLMLAVLASVTGCESKSFQYTFRQNRNNVEKVEICAFDYSQEKTVEPLRSLTGDDIDAILSDLSSMECWKQSGLDSPRSYGDILICIHYLDGEIEVIGTVNIGWITPNGDWHLTMNFFKFNDLREILLKYVDADTLAAASEDF